MASTFVQPPLVLVTLVLIAAGEILDNPPMQPGTFIGPHSLQPVPERSERDRRSGPKY
jgi:hypothetical protein